MKFPQATFAWHRAFGTIATMLALSLPCAPAMAQNFPNKPVRLVVANGAGSITDIAARLMSPAMGRALGQAVVVEAMPGASGLIASEYVAKQPGDGYTLLYGSNNLVLLPVFVKDLKLDPVRDLPPVTIVTELISLISSSAQAPWKDFNEMIAYLKANPGKVNYASTGLNGATTMNLEVLKSKAGLSVVNIPYKGGSPDVLRALSTNAVAINVELVRRRGPRRRRERRHQPLPRPRRRQQQAPAQPPRCAQHQRAGLSGTGHQLLLDPLARRRAQDND